MMKFRTITGLLIPLCILLPGTAAHSAVHTRVELYCLQTELKPEEDLRLVFRLTMDEGWHTYWINPGEAGMATAFAWTLPAGWGVHEIHWPVPERTETDGIVTYTLEGQTDFQAVLRHPGLIAPHYDLEARISWLECLEACIPGDTSIGFALDRMVNGEGYKITGVPLYHGVSTWPVQLDSPVQARLNTRILKLQIPFSREIPAGQELTFFPSQGGIYVLSESFQVRETRKRYTLILPLLSSRQADPLLLEGVLVVGNNRAYNLEIPLNP